jgi:hypothetical protein
VRAGFFAVVFAAAPFAVVFAVAPPARRGRLVPLDAAAARVCPLAEREEARDDAPDVFLALLLGPDVFLALLLGPDVFFAPLLGVVPPLRVVPPRAVVAALGEPPLPLLAALLAVFRLFCF